MWYYIYALVNVSQRIAYTELRSRVKVEVAVPNSRYCLFGRKATLKKMNYVRNRAQSCVKVEVAVSNSPYGLCGLKATLN